MRPTVLAYPSVQEYCEALQNPRSCFASEAMKRAVPATDARGLPLPRTGGVAAVFELDLGDGTTCALKVFKHSDLHREQRYRVIDDYLKTFQSPYLVGFAYENEGIRVPRDGGGFRDALRYPYLRMDWVAGDPLNKWLEKQVQAQADRAVVAFADRFEAMVRELKSRTVAHGDLQQGNVLVVGNEPVLVDYDGMYVPALTEPAEEFGLDGFQHPLRKELQWWSPDLDDFSAWIIWLTLRAIGADLTLWDKHKVADSNSMLFELQDLTRPAESKVWPDLLKSKDREVATRTDALFASLRPPHKVPPFRLDRTRRLRELCDAAVKDWEAIDTEANELKRAAVALLPDLQTMADRARQLVEGRDRLATALATRDPRRILAALPGELETEWPACASLVAQARRAETQVRAIEELDEALLPPGDVRAFAALWKVHASLLAGVPGTERHEFLAVLAAPSSEQAIVAAWDKLRAAGGHPSIPDPHPRVQLAQKRLPLLAAVNAVPRRAQENHDRDFVLAYQPALLADCAEAAALRRWYYEARPRVIALDLLDEIVTNGRAGIGPDRYYEQLRDAANALPPNYPHALAKDVEQALEWLLARGDLEKACAAQHWEEVVALAKSHVFARELPSDLVLAVQKAMERVEARRQLDGAIASGSLERTAAAYRPELLDDWPDCAGLVARARRARQLLPVLKRLQQEAANPGDGRALVALWREHGSDLANWREAAALRQAVATWEVRLAARDEFERLLGSDRPTAASIVEGWKKLNDAGGHPDAAAWAAQVEQAKERVERMERLRRVPAEPSESADRLFDAGWGDVLNGWWEAEGWRSRLDVVRHRLGILAQLEEPLRRNDDLAIEALAAGLPPAYRFAQPARQARIAQAHQRAGVLSLVLRAFAEQRWQDVVNLAGGLQGIAWPAELKQKVDAAAARVAAKQDLQTALNASSLERTAAAYRPDLLDDWPDCAGLVARAKQAQSLLPTLAALRAAAAAPGTGRHLIELWQTHADDVAGWTEFEPIRQAAVSWQARIDALETYLGLTDAEEVSARALTTAWHRLQAAGGHPDAEGLRDLADLMRQRADRLDALRAVPDEASESADDALVAAWDEKLLGGWWEAESLRPRLAAAAERRAVLAAIDEAMKRGDDARAAALADELPGYAFVPRRRDAVRRSRERVRLATVLRRAIDAQPDSDLAIAEAHDDHVTAGLSLPDPDDVARCDLAHARRRALVGLRKIAPATPADVQDQTVMRLWSEGSLASCNDVKPEERGRHELARKRSALARQLLDAVAARNLVAVVEAADDKVLAGYPPVEAMRPVMEEMMVEGRKVAAVLDAIRRDGDDEAFARLDLDLGCVAEHLPSFENEGEALRRLLLREANRVLLRAGKLELTGEGHARQVLVRWANCTWRTFGLGEWACKVAVSAEEIPDDPTGVAASLVTASGYRAGVRRDVPKDARRVHVTVWPLLRLDALRLEVTGRPLHLSIEVPELPPTPWWRGIVARIIPNG